MILFHDWIKDARRALGFTSAKEFHRSKSQDISMSYESYANLEAGKYLPPSEKLTNLVQALEIQDMKGFIFSYCYTLMPNELFKNFFTEGSSAKNSMVLKNDSYNNYKEKFHALLDFNRMQAKYELNADQIAYLETDLVAWDILNLFITGGDEGLTLLQISEKTDSGLESTKRRVLNLTRLQMIKEVSADHFLVTQDAFIIPRKASADKLTHALVQREMERSFSDSRNRPYTRFRFMAIDPKDRDNIEAFIDNFVLDSRRFKHAEGTTHYLQILFSDRNDLL